MGLSFSQIAIEHSLMYNKDVIKKQEEIRRERERVKIERERERIEREKLSKEDNFNLNKINEKNKFYII
mgnify:CR=1 FL=1